MNYYKSGRFQQRFKETHPSRYFQIYRGQILVLSGYCIVSIETIAAIWLGLSQVSYGRIFIISSFILLSTFILFEFIRIKRRLLVWEEWLIFIINFILYLIFFCFWIYFLGNFRILGLLNSLFAITIVLSYTNLIQSLIMSISTVACYFAVSFYALTMSGQSGSFERESFLALCLIPAFILIAVTARSMEKHRKKLQCAKKELESANCGLHELNRTLQYEQSRSAMEMDLAHDIQSSLFPANPPCTANWDVAFISKPRYGVSGDFYDFYSTGDTLNGISLFDVSGHGVAPGLITILTKPVLFRNFKNHSCERLGKILDATNDDLMEQLEEVSIFITGILLRMKENFVEYVNAGHPDLLHYQYSSGHVRVVADTDGKFRGKPLGISMLKSRYTTLKFSVAEGDVLCLFSDCFYESRNIKGEHFGRDRIATALAGIGGMNAEDALEHILGVFRSFTGSEAVADDMTVIVARRR